MNATEAATKKAWRFVIGGGCVAAVLFLTAWAAIHAAMQMYGTT
jgi:hypothetical protein